MALEYLIKSSDEGWINLQKKDFLEVLTPKSVPSTPVEGWGDHRILCEGVEIAFSFEDVGVQIIVEGDIKNDRSDVLIQEICDSLSSAMGQQLNLVFL